MLRALLQVRAPPRRRGRYVQQRCVPRAWWPVTVTGCWSWAWPGTYLAFALDRGRRSIAGGCFLGRADSVLWGWTYFGEPHSSACGEVPRAVPACSTLMELTLT